jgi:drug/metabolite transporter (DMT)-like permease
VLASIFLHERPTVRQIAGVLLAFLGVVVIAYPKLGAVNDIIAMLIMLAGAFMQSVNTICMKRAIDQDQLVINAIQCTFGGLAILAFIFATGSFRPISPTPEVLGSIAYVAILATAVANLLWSRALTLFTASGASMIIFMAPVFGHVWSWLILREAIDPFEVAGATMVIAGMAISTPQDFNKNP